MGTSALEGQAIGYLKKTDTVVFNVHELLYVASNEALAMAEAGYRPPLKAPLPGRPAAAAPPRSGASW